MNARCDFCGAPCWVRQVPVVGVPCSDAYCDTPACVKACRLRYLPAAIRHRQYILQDEMVPELRDILEKDIAEMQQEIENG
jgi:hypothetical protein